MTVTLNIDIPDAALNEDPEAFGREMRIAAAVKWYEIGRVSQGRAAEIAGLGRAEFIETLSKFGVSPFQVTPEGLEAEFKD